MSKHLAGLASAAVALALASPASATHLERYYSDLVPLNPTGVAGRADLTYNSTADTLAVSIRASGLTPEQTHFQHIHGIVNGDGSAGDSQTPSIAEDDADGDGYVELLEAFGKYGFILVPLTDEDGLFPMANSLGELEYDRVFDLSDDSIYGAGFGREDLFPLDFREIVIHGVTDPLDAGEGMTTTGALGLPENEIDAQDNGYEPLAPTAAGAISAVPVPAAVWLLGAGVAGLAGAGARRRRAKG